jgi:hypothetical protein
LISACERDSDVRRACFWSNGKRAVYYDRGGALWELAVERQTSSRSGDAWDGSASLRGRARARPGELVLTVTFHVGANVASVPAPNAWGSGEFADLF